MRYSPDHKQETRERLLDSSRAIAKKGGFEGTGVDALMAAIGLTGGAFYSHFSSKAELFEEIVEREMAHTDALLAGTDGDDSIEKTVGTYLGRTHALHPEAGCALPTLGAEIARGRPEARAKVERALKKTHRRWTERLGGDPDKAWALMAQCVGTVLLVRVVESDRARSAILGGSRRALLRDLG